jgi:hypothetical protein
MPSVEMALEFAKFATKQRYPTACISASFVWHPRNGMTKAGGTKYQQARREVFHDIEHGRVLGLSGYNTFLEGVDIPNASVLVWGRPTKSEPLITQAVGRVTRTPHGVARILVDGETNEYIIYFDDDHIERFSPQDMPYDTSCTVIDVTATGTTLLTVGTLWGDKVKKPAKKEDAEDVVTERLTEGVTSLRGGRGSKFGNGLHVIRRELVRRTHLSFYIDESRGTQSMALNNHQTLFIVPPNDLRAQQLFEQIDNETNDMRRQSLAYLSNIMDGFSLWFVDVPLRGTWPLWSSKDAAVYLCGIYDQEGSVVTSVYPFISEYGDRRTILSDRSSSWRRDLITQKQINLFTAITDRQWQEFSQKHRIELPAVRSYLQLHPNALAELVGIDVAQRHASKKAIFVLSRKAKFATPMLPVVIRYTKGVAVDCYRHVMSEMLVRIVLNALQNGTMIKPLTYEDKERDRVLA